jgi:hypothetical protein
MNNEENNENDGDYYHIVLHNGPFTKKLYVNVGNRIFPDDKHNVSRLLRAQDVPKTKWKLVTYGSTRYHKLTTEVENDSSWTIRRGVPGVGAPDDMMYIFPDNGIEDRPIRFKMNFDSNVLKAYITHHSNPGSVQKVSFGLYGSILQWKLDSTESTTSSDMSSNRNLDSSVKTHDDKINPQHYITTLVKISSNKTCKSK